MNVALHSVEHLGKFEHLQLVEDLWDEFATESSPETYSTSCSAAPHGGMPIRTTARA